LASLNLDQYHHRGFHDVRRKGSRVSKKVSVPSEARELLDRYVDERRGREPGMHMTHSK
jgi:integrase/recombinase XerD